MIQLGHTQDTAAQAKMEKLAVEASRLLGCVKLLNHDVHKAMLDGKLDPSLANTHRLGTAFYTNLTVGSCTMKLRVCLRLSFAFTESLFRELPCAGVNACDVSCI